jgi:putative zinc finger/helix-turn-helix YgiT family protein
MNGFCPYCEKETELRRKQATQEIAIRGELIPIEQDYMQCLECHQEFVDPNINIDPLPAAYEEYRRRKGMVQPRQIRSFREKHGLSQQDLSRLSGIGMATLSRYENGALQDETHDTILQLIMEPRNLIKLLHDKPDALLPEKQAGLLKRLQAETSPADMLAWLRDNYYSKFAQIINGQRMLDVSKLVHVIRFLCFNNRVYKTKMNKLLFYADFKHYKENSISITGLAYAHLPFGPCPDHYEALYEALLQFDPSIEIREDSDSDNPAEFFICHTQPDLTQFDDSELKVLAEIKHYFSAFSAQRITSYVHQEKAYIETSNGQLIHYSFASELSI